MSDTLNEWYLFFAISTDNIKHFQAQIIKKRQVKENYNTSAFRLNSNYYYFLLSFYLF